MIKHLKEYRHWIVSKGVGTNDQVASSPDSYVSYLNSVSRILDFEISPATLSSEDDITSITDRLTGARANKTIKNYKTAMSHYVAMSKSLKLK